MSQNSQAESWVTDAVFPPCSSTHGRDDSWLLRGLFSVEDAFSATVLNVVRVRVFMSVNWHSARAKCCRVKGKSSIAGWWIFTSAALNYTPVSKIIAAGKKNGIQMQWFTSSGLMQPFRCGLELMEAGKRRPFFRCFQSTASERVLLTSVCRDEQRNALDFCINLPTRASKIAAPNPFSRTE